MTCLYASRWNGKIDLARAECEWVRNGKTSSMPPIIDDSVLKLKPTLSGLKKANPAWASFQRILEQAEGMGDRNSRNIQAELLKARVRARGSVIDIELPLFLFNREL
jgi:hypothetical protein